jgi:hypothetical protein
LIFVKTGIWIYFFEYFSAEHSIIQTVLAACFLETCIIASSIAIVAFMQQSFSWKGKTSVDYM